MITVTANADAKPVMMQSLSNWFHHLYFCELMSLQWGQGQVYVAAP